MKQFDKNADAYHIIRGKIAYPESLYKTLSEKCRTHDAALDIGCGNGVSTILLKPYFKHVEGRDIGSNLIDKARETYTDLAFQVQSGEDLESERKFDLVTSATSFYWMNRTVVLKRVADVMNSEGMFCAYKYDFPVVYGGARDIVEGDLALRWAKHRDTRLTNYDDTLQLISSSGSFMEAERFIVSNIIELTPLEVALFFLSTSYVTRYIEAEQATNYADDFISRICAADSGEKVFVNFDIHGFMARKKA